jgi:hypothetical protein
MNTPRENDAALIDAYLDGAMPEPDRAAFERRIGTEPELSRELELQRRIDARLVALLAPPETIVIPSGPGAGTAPRAAGAIPMTPNRRGIPAWARLAALLVLFTLGAWAGITRPWKGWLGPEPSDVAANVSYTELVKGGLKPMWKCDSDEVFKKYTRENLGTAFTIAPAPGVEVVGWTYASGLLDSSAQILMCRVDGKPSIVVMGKKDQDRAMHADVASGVKIHRQERFGLVMYELNQRDDAPILSHVKAE